MFPIRIDTDFRRRVLHQFGANEFEADELLAYNENPFRHNEAHSIPLPDEPFVAAWAQYAKEAQQHGIVETLRDKLVQFRFPIEAGMSQSPVYKSATLRGKIEYSVYDFLRIEAPEALSLELYATSSGSVPLLITRHRSDFVTLVQALTRKNEPVPIPDSMGACMITDYNNWDRISQYRSTWLAQEGNSVENWGSEFSRLIPQKELYRDRFILLSNGAYSAVSHETLGLDEIAWKEMSLIIRREHECAHYYTKRVLGSMRNNMLDELIADFMGLYIANGRFKADWFLHFIGLEDFPRYREGGRLQNYRATLSEGAFKVLQRLMYHAAHHLEACQYLFDGSHTSKANILNTLTQLTLEAFASDNFHEHTEHAFYQATGNVLATA